MENNKSSMFISTLPPCNSIIDFTMLRPKPLPCVVLDSSPRLNLSNSSSSFKVILSLDMFFILTLKS